MSVDKNLEQVMDRVNKASETVGRDPKEVTIVAVTKYVSNERAEEAVKAGLLHLGENRPEGLEEKKKALHAEQIKWHFIGTLQSRKVKKVINDVDFLHSLDRLSLAEEIQKRAEHPIKCFLQVNVSGEEQKHGLSPENASEFVEQLESYDKIEVIGLMTMAPNTQDEAVLRNCFRNLRELRDRIQEKKLANVPCTELSMGMSNDFEIAIQEGATYIRIGSSLVGE
ncbi:YggS family pyridoxal phosphate-dependent enzyme [Jeotgalibacillus sp. R-1-5s-1]|uniref:YggS family pyridoxal phosphate-dependent enzyme n=1 Tax=Jeotgalibacillus sp. R-1-5s-1 TaxID=2555897 RepID=UPI00106CC0EA|nr:YggS family pyridoxal phosphate-dependent enzyme [Jeotgalibacillus sp. R-1-5s-1]TFE03566.1 YggS family pyridoxal phosphate-dependent enzyme [Jeotgalibacillus sp. R-1-5s-1]